MDPEERETTGEGSPEEETAEASRPARGRARREKWYRSGWFEPVLALLIIAALLLGAYGYTQNWPPLVVVESGSMQHGTQDIPGLINAGDIVLVQKVPVPSGINTYVQGEENGYTSYGEYGNVILYYPNGNMQATPVVHRALLWLNYLPSQGTYSAPSLANLACGTGGQYLLEQGPLAPSCLNPNNPNAPITGTIELLGVGWESETVTIDLGNLAQNAPRSGFITLGDNNGATYDQSGGCIISCLVQSTWVWGVARGMIPWFGAIKLLAEGYGNRVPSMSWVYMGLVMLAVAAVVTVGPWLYRRRREGVREPPGAEDPGDPGQTPDPEGYR
ncbi:signal peptidase I [mine drainage metagenome]|uniref:Signal peptidase I n=1 Tax=mine drainage metagenome TaxID=410659 RepID=T1C691_9ZZZZ